MVENRSHLSETMIRSLMLALLLLSPLASITAAELNLYSARHYDTDFSLYERFTEETGIKVNLIEGGSDALIERILAEGELSPADILITVDAGRLWRAAEAGIFQQVDSATLDARVPEYLRDPDNLWFGLSKRARVIVYRKDEGLRVPANYEDLTNSEYRSRVCMRSSSNIYNLSLLAGLIETTGAAAAQRWAEGVVQNFARRPQGNDTAQLRAVASGECGVTVANTYYLGRLMASDDPADKAVVAKLGIVFPDQDGRGTHINISGAGVTRYAPNRAAAIQFVEYLTSEFAQRLFAEGNNEYPIVGRATGPIAELGDFKEDQVNAATYGKRQAQAVMIYDRAGWR
ncbi:MAG: iron(III) transport system substrate-binding protein [Candidatus Azotimanducaceae bacterium]|jgi:iron(III) transport system substrate-binding protein